MDNRRTIREYLDNPRLLSEISIEELQSWADGVPYAAIIHQLMAMKVVQEEETSVGREILQRATLHSPNPDRLSRELHKLAADTTETKISHTFPDGAAQISTSEIKVTPFTEAEPLEDTGQVNPIQVTETIKESAVEATSSSEAIAPITDEVEVIEDENELSDFSQWLLSLKKVASSETDSEDDSILEVNSDIASETLAELLVKQGHRKRAIAMYEQLTLKYPKKSSFFAGQIQKIQGL